jgi:hypothetical protein
VLEKKITVATPCRHPLPLLIDPTEDELEDAHEMIAACPRCSVPSIGPKIVIIQLRPSPWEFRTGSWILTKKFT